MTMSPELGFIHYFEEPTAGTTQAAPPVLLLLHGTGGDEQDLVSLGRTLAPGLALLSPRGKVLEQGMPRFFRRLALGVFDEADVRFRAAELAEFLAVARAHYELGTRPIYALGYSNGANIAAALLLLHPEVLAGAILLRATLPLAPEAPPVLTGKPILVAQGHTDPYVPPAQGAALEGALRAAGADLETLRLAQGHALEDVELAPIRQWSQAHLV